MQRNSVARCGMRVFVTDTAAGTYSNTVRKRAAAKRRSPSNVSDNKLGRVSSQWRIYDKFILFLFVNAHVSFVRVQTNAHCKHRDPHHNREEDMVFTSFCVIFTTYGLCILLFIWFLDRRGSVVVSRVCLSILICICRLSSAHSLCCSYHPHLEYMPLVTRSLNFDPNNWE